MSRLTISVQTLNLMRPSILHPNLNLLQNGNLLLFSHLPNPYRISMQLLSGRIGHKCHARMTL